MIRNLINFFEGTVDTNDVVDDTNDVVEDTNDVVEDAEKFIEHEKQIIIDDTNKDVEKEIERIENDIASGHFKDEVRKIRDDVQYDALKEVVKISKDTMKFLKEEYEKSGDVQLERRVLDLEKRLKWELLRSFSYLEDHDPRLKQYAY